VAQRDGMLRKNSEDEKENLASQRKDSGGHTCGGAWSAQVAWRQWSNSDRSDAQCGRSGGLACVVSLPGSRAASSWVDGIVPMGRAR
jgi:hypothetical protein